MNSQCTDALCPSKRSSLCFLVIERVQRLKAGRDGALQKMPASDAISTLNDCVLQLLSLENALHYQAFPRGFWTVHDQSWRARKDMLESVRLGTAATVGCGHTLYRVANCRICSSLHGCCSFKAAWMSSSGSIVDALARNVIFVVNALSRVVRFRPRCAQVFSPPAFCPNWPNIW